MRFAGDRAEQFMGNSPNLGMVANQSLQNQSEERALKMQAEGEVAAASAQAKATVKAGAAQADAAQFSGIMGGLSSGISGGLGALGKTNVGTTRGVSQFSQPHASGIGREAFGGYDL
jgi:anti-sigma factor RsiW